MSNKSFIYLINAALGKKFCNLRRRPIVFLIFLDTIFIIPKWFWEDVRVTLALLNSNGGWTFFNLRLKMTSWACLVVFGLKFIFHAQLLILSKFLLRLFAEVWMSCVTENKDVSSAKSFALDEMPLDH